MNNPHINHVVDDGTVMAPPLGEAVDHRMVASEPRTWALAYLRAGCSVIPIRTDGSKAPALSEWTPFRHRLPTEDEVRDWFHDERGVAIVCGAISQTEVIDFDEPDLFGRWRELATLAHPALLDQVAIIRTPGEDRWHVHLHRSRPARSQKLAERLVSDPNGKLKKVTLIETRGEGGYAIAPGSAPATHSSGRIYAHVAGPTIAELRQQPPLGDAEYEVLINAAQSLNEIWDERRVVDGAGGAFGPDRPGDDYNRGARWTEILDKHGWVRVRGDDECAYWKRPAKEGNGISATTGYCKSDLAGDLLYVFSTNASPFEAGKAYSKFAAYTLLNHGGDYQKAAAALRGLGYGRPRDNAERPSGEPTAALVRKPQIVVPEFQLFPIDALPSCLRQFVLCTSTSIGCDPSYVALPGLCVLAGAIGNTARIQLKRGWTEPCVLWGAIVGLSGQQKSPALDVVLRPVEALQSRAFTEYQAAQQRYEIELLAFEKDLKEWMRGNRDGAPPEKPRPPALRRYSCSDITVEALAIQLRDQPRGLLLSRDELAGWLGGFDQYKNARGSDVTHWLELHGARAMTVDRKTGNEKLVRVPMANCSITGGIQPEILGRRLGRHHFHDGLAARLLLAHPPRHAKRWSDADIPPEVEASFLHLLERLYGLELRVDASGTPVPKIVTLSAEAKVLWVAFYDEHGLEQVQLDADLAAAWSKLEAYASRIALVLHLVRWASGERVNRDVVDDVSMAAAIRLTRWFGYEAKRVYAELQESEEDRERRRFVEMVRGAGGKVTVRNWHRTRSLASADAAKAELQQLVDAGLGRWQAKHITAKGGHPTEYFVVEAPPSDRTPASDLGDGVVSVSEVSEESTATSCSISTEAMSSTPGHEDTAASDPDPATDERAQRANENLAGDVPMPTTVPMPAMPGDGGSKCPDTSDTDTIAPELQPAGVVPDAAVLGGGCGHAVPLPRGKKVCPVCGSKCTVYVASARAWLCTACRPSTAPVAPTKPPAKCDVGSDDWGEAR